MEFKSDEQHQRDVLALRKAVRESGGKQLSLQRRGGRSNLTRSATFKRECHLLNVSTFNRVLSVDDGLLIAEPLVTMEQMVKAAVKQGWVPQVVPEFRGITVGGALNGAAMESSSCRYGLFNDTIAWCEMVLGNGDLVRVSPEKNSDLFHALAGSYGTFGIITRVAIRLVPAKPSVQVEGSVVSRAELVEALKGSEEFCDGLALSPHAHLVMKGQLTDAAPTMRIRSHSPWWYQTCYEKAAKGNFTLVLPLVDYLFRYDQGAFWMGRYLTDPAMLATYLRKSPLAQAKIDRVVRRIEKERHWQKPGPLFRALFGTVMGSQKLYKGLHAMSNEIVADEFLIQDSMLPTDQVAGFLDYIDETHGLWPIWLCPGLGTDKPQILSPHAIAAAGERVVNVGTYGVSMMGKAQEATRHLEEKVAAIGGRKALYSHSYYTPEAFWKIYDRKAYELLRERYHAHVFPQLTEKVLTPC